jgi:hypothetical protein
MTPPEQWTAGEWMLAAVLFVFLVCLVCGAVDRLEAWWRARHPRPCELCRKHPARPGDALCWSCVLTFRPVLRHLP